jgi:general secretion pathway protein D
MKKKHIAWHGARLGAAALAAQLLVTAAGAPSALAQDATPRRGEPITLNFTNAEIDSVARTMAVVTGRDVVVDPRVKGTLTLQTDRPIAPEAAFNQFAAALRLQGFAVVPGDGLYKVVPEADAKLQSTAVTTASAATASLAGNQIVTQVFKLNYESANALLPVLRPLIAANNTINVNPGNNSLVITDYAENMRRLGRIIAALDVPNASDIEVIPLKHSIATDLVPLVNRMLEGGAGTAAAPAGGAPGVMGDASFRTTLLAEPRSNALILRAANPARAQLVRSLVAKLDRAPSESVNSGMGNIHVVYLKNADAVRLAATLRAAMVAETPAGAGGALGGAASTQPRPAQQAGAAQADSGSPSPQATAPLNNANQPSTGGQIQADPSTNSLIITAPEPQFRQLRAVIDRLDSQRAQVFVESLIVEVNADKAAEFGIQWQGGIGNSGDKNVGFIGNNSNTGGANIVQLAAALATGDAAAATSSLSSGLNFGVGTRYGGQYVLGFLARFLQSNGEANVLSTPNLLTLDNEEAKIMIGQNVPFVTGQYANTGANGTINPFNTYERKDVGLTLRVRPTVNEANMVKLQVFQEVSAVVQSTVGNASGPTTNKRSIESSVMVENGGIIVLGGLLQDDYSTNNEKVPLMGDIPILGNLFKSETRSRKKTNLMVFLRPVVVRNSATSDQLTLDRYDMIRGLQIGAQPEQSLPLRNVGESNVLPQLPPPRSDRGIEGTRLVPPPMPPASPPASSGSPRRGAPPPTAHPARGRAHR